jgi:hypothetical protein
MSLLSPVGPGFTPEPADIGLAEQLTTPVGGELVGEEEIGVEHDRAFRCLVVFGLARAAAPARRSARRGGPVR